MGFAIWLEMTQCPDGAEIFNPPPTPADQHPPSPVWNFPLSGYQELAADQLPLFPLENGTWFSPPGGPGVAMRSWPPEGHNQAQDELTQLIKGPQVRYRSAARKSFERKLNPIEEPLLEKFINCLTDEQLVDFMSEYAIPDWGRQLPTMPLELVTGFRDALRALVMIYRNGDIEKAAELLSRERHFADLRPVLSVPRGSATASWAFKVFSLCPFLCLEAGSIFAGGATIMTCLNCGNLFVAGPSTGRRTTSFYCRNRCRVAHQRREENGSANDGKIRTHKMPYVQ
jgi:hypothetical protein